MPVQAPIAADIDEDDNYSDDADLEYDDKAQSQPAATSSDKVTAKGIEASAHEQNSAASVSANFVPPYQVQQ